MDFILRNADDDLWQKFRDRAQSEGRTMRWIVLELIAFYVAHGLPQAPPRRRK